MTSDWVFLGTAIVAGAFVGSFLNVLIFRGAALWGLTDAPERSRGDFLAPPSYCPQCRTAIAWHDLAPVLSYLRLSGKCRVCRTPISPAYPLVELLAAAAAALSLIAYGLSVDALFCALALFLLIAIGETDRQTAYIPDALSMTLLWLGLLANLDGRFTPLKDAVIGAVAGYTAFAFVGLAYRRIRGREGLGDGDAVLLAGIGAWCGWAALPVIVLVGAGATLLWLLVQLMTGRGINMQKEIAFGPGLSFAGALALLATRAPWHPFGS